MVESSSRRPSRRPSRRIRRRLQVRLRQVDNGKSSIGYTTNISKTGMFVATIRPVPPGTRLDVELSDKKQTLHLDAIVVHARKSPPNWQHVLPSGMGIRFLDAEGYGDTLLELMGRAAASRAAAG